jgi:hypothetical protein
MSAVFHSWPSAILSLLKIAITSSFVKILVLLRETSISWMGGNSVMDEGKECIFN